MIMITIADLQLPSWRLVSDLSATSYKTNKLPTCQKPAKTCYIDLETSGKLVGIWKHRLGFLGYQTCQLAIF